ncbi:trehalose-phosphatase [Halovivax sp.]|uniref:trehalose-phosphatase n=1 Tax=Halovivax sp. TaxID=1935978 RepID=UPI0025BFADD5|nr:trehalose-phosphatase [Halovivax sp.]
MSETAASHAEGCGVPPRIEGPTDGLCETLRDGSRLLCCLDFDGTLAPIVDDPDEATMTPANRRALAALSAEPSVSVAVVSGRGIADLRTRIDRDVTLVGNHGLEIARDGTIATHPVAAAREPTIATCCGLLETRFDAVPNCEVEHKRLTGTVHLRSVPDSARRLVERTTRSVVERIGDGGLTLAGGKEIREFSPAIDWGKGDAVELLRADHSPDASTLYVGDDATDEHAFAALRSNGIGVLVGRARPSNATYRVDSPAGVAELLQGLAADDA